MSSKQKLSKKQQRLLKKRRQRRAIIITVALLVLALGITAISALAPDDINAERSSVNDVGLVRVMLKSLGAPKTLSMTLDGVYTVDGDAGFRFAKGTEIAVAEHEGSLLLSAGGLTIDMGGSFKLTRHAPDSGTDAGGLYIHESELNNLYAGDLNVSSNGSAIECILTLQVEDYLYGVLGYEMSNAFPLEALKAQAIAARTYVMYEKSKRASYSFDVYDTAQSQVFKGYDSSLKNVIKAVDATRGIVEMVSDGSYGDCWFTASNGGQVAASGQIWSTDVSYIQMKDDPYDAENSLSTTKSALIPRVPEEDAALTKKLLEQLNIENASYVRIDSINSVTLINPDREGSRMYSAAEFDLTLSARFMEEVLPEVTASAEPTTAPTPTLVEGELMQLEGSYTVTLETYGCLKSLLNIGINSQDYEVFSLTESDEGFTLTTGRFGHGVGLSQRGAQTMAGKHDMDCEEILSFYYPGLTLYKIDWAENTLTALEELPETSITARAKATPHPTRQPLPALSEGEYYAEVLATTLNVRSGPGTEYTIVAQLYSGERVIVTGEASEDWLNIKTGEFTGCVKGSYLEKE